MLTVREQHRRRCGAFRDVDALASGLVPDGDVFYAVGQDAMVEGRVELSSKLHRTPCVRLRRWMPWASSRAAWRTIRQHAHHHQVVDGPPPASSGPVRGAATPLCGSHNLIPFSPGSHRAGASGVNAGGAQANPPGYSCTAFLQEREGARMLRLSRFLPGAPRSLFRPHRRNPSRALPALLGDWRAIGIRPANARRPAEPPAASLSDPSGCRASSRC
jgi:hypothetical protein